MTEQWLRFFGGLSSTPVSGVPYEPPALTAESEKPRSNIIFSILS